ncbi:hypothetical protein GYH30_004871 [Glycine max]|nr:hypothetical protein GYH30_004871 [Glycine max]
MQAHKEKEESKMLSLPLSSTKILNKFYKCVIVVQPLWKPLQVVSNDQIHFNQMEKRRKVNRKKKKKFNP